LVQAADQMPKVLIRFFLQLLPLVAVEEKTQPVEQTATAVLVEVEEILEI
jgi:hypothetical protein